MRFFSATLLLFFLISLWGTVSAFSAEQAIVAKRTIYPGQTITLEDLKAVVLTKKPTITYRFVENFDEVTGKVASKTILPGRFIAVNAARASDVIKAGSSTWVSYKSGTLSIKLLCIALSSGTVGSEIRLRNPTSGKTFTGHILENGTVVASSS